MGCCKGSRFALAGIAGRPLGPFPKEGKAWNLRKVKGRNCLIRERKTISQSAKRVGQRAERVKRSKWKQVNLSGWAESGGYR